MDNEPEEDGGDVVYTHRACGYPIFQDAEGNWHHVSEADGVFCSLFGGAGQ